jgi:hypothetical protein
LKDLLQRLAFVLLAAFLWLLTKSASTGVTLRLSQEVVITDIPGVIPEEATQTVVLDMIVKSAGLKSLGLRLSGLPVVTYSYQSLNISEWGTEDLLWWVVHNRNVLEGDLPEGVQLLDLRPDSLFIPITPMDSKSIPVVFQGVVPLPEGYQSTDRLKLEPSSVVVYGPKDALDEIHSLVLEPDHLKWGTEPGIFEAKVHSRERLTFSHQRILMQIKAEPFTEWRGNIPVVVVGVPQGLRVETVHDSVKVSIPIPTRLYRPQAHADWIAQVNFSSWKSAGYPELVKPVLELPGGPVVLPAIRPIVFLP